jgi:hypothetical protein
MSSSTAPTQTPIACSSGMCSPIRPLMPGWMVFALPPAELAIHQAEANGAHEQFLMCDDVQAFIAQMSERGVACSNVSRERWGSMTAVTMPGGGSARVYEPTPFAAETGLRTGSASVSHVE